MSENLTNWKKTGKHDYLGEWDLIGGKDIVLTIEKCDLKEVENPQTKDKTVKVIAYFKEKNYKPMILNSTNCKQIEKFIGSKFIENWQNVLIQLFVQTGIKAFGNVTDGLRIRPKQPTLELPELIENSDTYNKVVDYLKAGNKTDAVLIKYKVSPELLTKLKTFENAN